MVRIEQHNSAARSLQGHYTNPNRPWTMVAVINGFTTRTQALRAEYMIKHQPHIIRHSVTIVARIATAQATSCNRLLRTDHKFSGVEALAMVIWEEDVYQAVHLTSVASGGVTLHYVGSKSKFSVVSPSAWRRACLNSTPL
jgi:predicted GIY-YIG superfamily endonuclease